ncbi:LOW QUALITY PROTEIN: uncharacterized protein LOC111374931 [Olea europaea var. sylvestris]|uniref:LOW QUALITY PROTEIN: uncharacterized protein LOC111374931 n=1 Tax=Olea europaea var. sylvestris TaxID=158386 RepID=UPI000C1D2DC9|nr:LOW QUALITY PROTEIN: uncharacterized protein LOC111374931 [Olea europaea var. sylvestris]
MERKIPLLRLFVGPPARTQWSGWLVVSGSRRNASFMPRVLATACIHSVIKPLLHSWTSFLNIVTFPCCVSGTFSIRSGLLAPVHSFATDDTREDESEVQQGHFCPPPFSRSRTWTLSLIQLPASKQLAFLYKEWKCG